MLSINDSPYQVIAVGFMAVYTIVMWVDIKLAFDKHASTIPLNHTVTCRPLEVDSMTGEATHTYYVQSHEQGKRQRVVEKVNEMYIPPSLRKRTRFRNIKLTESVDSYYNISTEDTAESSMDTTESFGWSMNGMTSSENGVFRMRDRALTMPIVRPDADIEAAPALRRMPRTDPSLAKV
mmetsp:Transcript_625/g.2291  ORF Transcript_625/g.2291 Transcript_625/m.2291 type:complete len:179 (-) Transcript_625:2302-2838(-)